MADEVAAEAPTSVLGGGEAPAEQPAEATPPTPPEPAAEQPEGGEAAEGEKEVGKPEGVPEKYEFTAPEGWEGELDQAALAELEPVARELGLTNEQANKLVAVQAKHLQSQQAQQQEMLVSQMETWIGDLKNDPDFGGAKYEDNVKMAQKAFTAFADEDLTQLLNSTGLCNHPAMVKAFHKIGQKISEDTMESGSGGSGQRSAADILYPNHATQ